MTTSVSLPADAAILWRRYRLEIMRFAERSLRIQMRQPIRREVARTYNRIDAPYQIVTTRFSAAEYDTLHYVAATLRVSVSSLIYGMIRFWLKPARRKQGNPYVTNYCATQVAWSQEVGIVEENLTFWRWTATDWDALPDFLKNEKKTPYSGI